MKRLCVLLAAVPVLAWAADPAPPAVHAGRSQPAVSPSPGRVMAQTNDPVWMHRPRVPLAPIGTNSVAPDPARESLLEQQLKDIESNLTAVAQDEFEVRRSVYTQRDAMTNMAAVVATQDVQVAKMTARIRELEAELAIVRTQLQSRVQSTPAYQDVTRQSQEVMGRYRTIRERQSELIQQKIRVSGELWMLKKARQEAAERGGTNAPANGSARP